MQFAKCLPGYSKKGLAHTGTCRLLVISQDLFCKRGAVSKQGRAAAHGVLSVMGSPDIAVLGSLGT